MKPIHGVLLFILITILSLSAKELFHFDKKTLFHLDVKNFETEYKIKASPKCTVIPSDQICLSGDKILLNKNGRTSILKELASPGFFGLTIPLTCFLFAFLFRNIFIGFASALLLGIIGLSFAGIPLKALEILNKIIFDSFRLQVLTFTAVLLLMGKTLNINGGVGAIFNLSKRFVKNKVGVQVTAFFSGLLLFFDDYANTVVIGNSFKTLFDKFKISRAKLAYIVDSTAAPIAGIMLFSTWIGFELQTIKDSLKNTQMANLEPYSLFTQSIPFRLYCLLALFMVIISILMKREFPSMKEQESIAQKQTDSDELILTGSPFAFILPIVTIIAVLIYGLIHTSSHTMANPFSSSEWTKLFSGTEDSSLVLLYASLSGFFVSLIFVPKTNFIASIKTLFKETNSFIFLVLTILFCAWFIGELVQTLEAPKLILLFLPENIPNWIWPSVGFIFAGITAFATGSSWTTMAILMPLYLPLVASFNLPQDTFLLCLASIMDGAILGDHISPISDTTVMSAASTDCDLMVHVKTQMPYALTAAFACLFIAAPLISNGIGWILSFGAASLFCVGSLLIFAKKAN